MKKTLLLLLLFTFTRIFAQGPIQPQQFNNVCDDNNDGFAMFYMQEIAFEIINNTPNIVVTHHLTQIDAANGTNAIVGDYTNISNPQTIYARYFNTATSVYQVVIYNLTVNPLPIATPQTLVECDTNGSGNVLFNLNNASQMIWNQNQSNPNSQSINYYYTQTDALAGMNQASYTFYATSNPQTIFYRIENNQTGCYAISTLLLFSENCSNTNCPTPTNVLSTTNSSNSVNISWIETGSASQWEISVNGSSNYITTTSNPYTLNLVGLPCNLDLPIKVRSICSSNEISDWSFVNYVYYECFQIGQPSSLSECLDNGVACFDLTQNTVPVLGNLSPSEYSVSYHTTTSGAFNNTDVIPNPSNYCINSNEVVHVRVQENANPTNFQLAYFNINAQTVIINTNTSIATLNKCDDDLNGQVVFDLTEAALNMNSPSTVTYFTSQASAVSNSSPIANPTSFTLGIQPVSTFVFARATYSNSTCQTIFKINLKAFAVCNNAYVCSEANSLCNALGQPFINTFQGIVAEPGNNYACLNTQPNPTWFYLPVSSAGNLEFLVQQSSDINFTSPNLDVDFICYGPFTSLNNACNMPMNTIVDCSYSASPVETINIYNALPGQYYLIMVTNYSAQPGYIKIDQTQGSNTANIDCSGLNFNAFLDANSNGTQDAGEVNFPLGTFTYQINDNGNNINVTSPNGEHNIYDSNPLNSYDVSFAVLPEYTSYYNVTTPSYQDLTIVVGAGLQTYNFPITVTQPYIDVATYIIPLQQPRPGFTYKEKVVYANIGSQTIASGTVTFTKDANLVITNNTQAGTTPNASGFTYNYINLLPFEIRFMDVTMQVPTIPSVQLGQLLTNSVNITPLTGDVVPLNNANSSSQIIIGSYDPNDKMESRGNQILHSSFTSDDYLYYTIRFENTGTASAVNVRVEDMIDVKLDESTIRIISSSHTYSLERIGTSLKWYFDNIQLPISVANTSTGKGYITFKVKPKPGYAVGDIIPNTANIYFDYNPAIVTNTFNSEFVTALAVSSFNETNITMYPNPAKSQVTVSLDNTNEVIANVTITDMLGKQVIKINKVNEVTKSIDLTSLNTGIYFLEIETQNKLSLKRKLIVK